MTNLKKEAQIYKYFSFYEKNVLPVVGKYATQKAEGYHGLHTHTDAVVFRALDYALELDKNPMPVLFAAACHDMARTNDLYDETHGENAVPLAQKVMNRFKKHLTSDEQLSVLQAIKNHTQGTEANDYVSACLWDADRTRLAWERGYYEHYFNTAYAKKVASGDAKKYIAWQNKILGRPNKDREGIQQISMSNEKTQLIQLMEKLRKSFKK